MYRKIHAWSTYTQYNLCDIEGYYDAQSDDN